MNKLLNFLAFCVVGSLIFSTSTAAGPAGDALSSCLADSTTGKDRKDLAQWMFVAVTAHPEIKPFSNVTEANREDSDKKMAAMATRLMTESCKVQFKNALETEGSAAVEAAFGLLGRLAMKELMSNPSVNESFARYAKYLDKSKFDAAFK